MNFNVGAATIFRLTWVCSSKQNCKRLKGNWFPISDQIVQKGAVLKTVGNWKSFTKVENIQFVLFFSRGVKVQYFQSLSIATGVPTWCNHGVSLWYSIRTGKNAPPANVDRFVHQPVNKTILIGLCKSCHELRYISSYSTQTFSRLFGHHFKKLRK